MDSATRVPDSSCAFARARRVRERRSRRSGRSGREAQLRFKVARLVRIVRLRLGHRVCHARRQPCAEEDEPLLALGGRRPAMDLVAPEDSGEA
eukprot:3550768-Prymnesium_polylepis.1